MTDPLTEQATDSGLLIGWLGAMSCCHVVCDAHNEGESVLLVRIGAAVLSLEYLGLHFLPEDAMLAKP